MARVGEGWRGLARVGEGWRGLARATRGRRSAPVNWYQHVVRAHGTHVEHRDCAGVAAGGISFQCGPGPPCVLEGDRALAADASGPVMRSTTPTDSKPMAPSLTSSTCAHAAAQVRAHVGTYMSAHVGGSGTWHGAACALVCTYLPKGFIHGDVIRLEGCEVCRICNDGDRLAGAPG